LNPGVNYDRKVRQQLRVNLPHPAVRVGVLVPEKWADDARLPPGQLCRNVCPVPGLAA
jgi:hypothetical protein